MFDVDDGSYPEICICNLTGDAVVAGYSLIRKIAGSVAGGPCFFNLEANCEMQLDEVDNAAALVVAKKAQPFHFMIRNITFGEGRLRELGIFILDNAIAIDFEKGPLWGEIEIETLLLLIIELMSGCEGAFIRLEDDVSATDKTRLTDSLKQLIEEQQDL